MLRHEKFLTAMALIVAIVLLAMVPAWWPEAFTNAEGQPLGSLRILDMAVGGLIAALGNQLAGTKSATDQDNAAGTRATAEANAAAVGNHRQ